MSDNRSPSSQPFPDLYALLGIEPLERDLAHIQQALKHLLGQIQTGPGAIGIDPKKLDRAKKLLELGNQHLLDPQRKLKYDQQWIAVFGSAAAPAERAAAPERAPAAREAARTAQISGRSERQSSNRQSLPPKKDTIPSAKAASPVAWDLSELRTLLPKEDPNQPFDPSTYDSSQWLLARSRYAEDFRQLQSLLLDSSVVVTEHATKTDPGTIDAVDEVGAIANPPAEALRTPQADETFRGEVSSKTSSTLGSLATTRIVGNRRSSLSLAKKLRKKREQGLLWSIIGALLSVGIVLAIAYWLLMPSVDDSLLAVNPKAEAATTSANALLPLPKPGNSPQYSQPRRSGLPSVPGLDAPAPANVADTPVSNQPSMPEEDTIALPAADPRTEMTMPGGTLPGEMMITESIPGDAMPSESIADDSMSAQPPPMSEPAVPEAVTLTDAEREHWTTTMLDIRQQLGQQQFDQAASQLEAAKSLAKTPLQLEQLARLVTIMQLADEFRQSLQRAIAGMGAGESFTVGSSTPVSFVEAAADRLTLRIQGKNQSFAWTELPIGLAYGIVDMAMDRQHPRSLACKAAFALVHPAAAESDLAIKNAKKMMNAAIADGAVEADMGKIFDDDYQLQ